MAASPNTVAGRPGLSQWSVIDRPNHRQQASAVALVDRLRLVGRQLNAVEGLRESVGDQEPLHNLDDRGTVGPREPSTKSVNRQGVA